VTVTAADQLRHLLAAATSPIGCSLARPVVPPPRPTKKKPTAGQLEQQAQHDRDRRAGRLVDLGGGGFHRRACRPAP
jgi:hypothetical protein